MYFIQYASNIETNSSHILFLDADIRPENDALEKLLEVNYPIVGGYCGTYCITGPLLNEYKFPVMDCGGTAGCILVEREVFKRIGWRWDLQEGMTDDPCYFKDVLDFFNYKIRIRKDCIVHHYPEQISPIDVRFGNKTNFTVFR
jgi:hypothetical protein